MKNLAIVLLLFSFFAAIAQQNSQSTTLIPASDIIGVTLTFDTATVVTTRTTKSTRLQVNTTLVCDPPVAKSIVSRMLPNYAPVVTVDGAQATISQPSTIRTIAVSGSTIEVRTVVEVLIPENIQSVNQ